MGQNNSLLHSVSLLLLVSGVLITISGKGLLKGVFSAQITSVKDYITGNDLIKEKNPEEVNATEEVAKNSRREIEGFDLDLFE